MKTIHAPNQKVQQTSSTGSKNKTTPSHITIELLKTNGKEKILTATRGKKAHYIHRNKKQWKQDNSGTSFLKY